MPMPYTFWKLSGTYSGCRGCRIGSAENAGHENPVGYVVTGQLLFIHLNI